MTTATSAATPTSSASSMSGMGMGMGPGSSCKISVSWLKLDIGCSADADLALKMLWNWYTIDACFLSKTWHVRSTGAFAGSCIGVIFLVISLELLRRVQREFDRYLIRRDDALFSRHDSSEGEDGNSDGRPGKANPSISIRSAGDFDHKAHLKLWQHLVRSFLYMMQFAVGYLVMLLAMYYNGTPPQSVALAACLRSPRSAPAPSAAALSQHLSWLVWFH